MKNYAIALLLLVSWSEMSLAQSKQAPKKAKQINVSEDVDTLGGNEDLIKMAQSLKSQTRARIVQDRIVDRRNKVEFAVSYGGIIGGDSYLKTQALGLNANYHISPRWSLGVQYTDFTNDLTPEGKRMYAQREANRNAGNGLPSALVSFDLPLSSTMAVLNWYPIYGKTSFLDMGITQFDLYMIAGAGQIELYSGSSPIISAGVGVGAWLSKHLSLRAEIKYQTYQDKPISDSRTLHTGSANVGIGWIL